MDYDFNAIAGIRTTDSSGLCGLHSTSSERQRSESVQYAVTLRKLYAHDWAHTGETLSSPDLFPDDKVRISNS